MHFVESLSSSPPLPPPSDLISCSSLFNRYLCNVHLCGTLMFTGVFMCFTEVTFDIFPCSIFSLSSYTSVFCSGSRKLIGSLHLFRKIEKCRKISCCFYFSDSNFFFWTGVFFCHHFVLFSTTFPWMDPVFHVFHDSPLKVVSAFPKHHV